MGLLATRPTEHGCGEGTGRREYEETFVVHRVEWGCSQARLCTVSSKSQIHTCVCNAQGVQCPQCIGLFLVEVRPQWSKLQFAPSGRAGFTLCLKLSRKIIYFQLTLNEQSHLHPGLPTVHSLLLHYKGIVGTSDTTHESLVRGIYAE